ncbi:ABC transporter permease subunit [Cryobacterium levicorallinum]|uniref:ABC transporter permease subunit n=1 Tax=Cryobacterium levicorallinum TaxID=995038 RepID=A0A1I2YMD3_9MICO|nr:MULTISPECIES: ABC transporter permease subunit [Cryobacterium]TFB86036.1 ABC transporter permease subunit [Cryobacterium levicorallinum]GEP27200.1 acriflavin resistance protein [Cryobacterium levicorallinum]SFH26509.1 putative spermidine/putrescine transport system permease protein [Cryobacterium levicorallinum]
MGLIPFLVFIAFFLGVPVCGIVLSAFRVADVNDPGIYVPSLANFVASFRGASWEAMQNSLQISLIAALTGGIIGLALAQAILTTRSKKLTAVVTVLTSVLANSGGVPLAFSFIAAVGNAGIMTGLLSLTDLGFTLYSSGGLILMYQYFLIPTMVMVVLPTLAGLRLEWKEAAASVGATSWHFWKKVGLPIATPAILAGFVLLFGASFATHASAAALIGGGGVPLITLRIDSGLAGGNLAGQENVAMALGVNMIIVALLVLLVYMPLQKRSLRWFQ